MEKLLTKFKLRSIDESYRLYLQICFQMHIKFVDQAI